MSPVYLAFSVLPCPHPPNPLPGGKGEIFCFLMQGASPLASPGLNPGGTGSTLRNRFFWCRRRTPVAVNKNFEKSSWGFGGFFQEAPKRFPAPCIPATEPGRHWLDFKKPILFGVVGERRLQSIKISRKVLGGLGASFKKPPTLLQRLPYTSAGEKIRCSIYKGVRRWYTIGETARCRTEERGEETMNIKGNRLCAAYVNDGGEAGIRRVYDDATRAQTEGLFDSIPGVFTAEDIRAGQIRDAQVLFSTWGMPVLTREQWADAAPKLEAVFYGAGSVRYFAEPLLSGGVRVFSAWQANGIPVTEYTVAQIILANKGFYGAARLCSRSRADRQAAERYFRSFRGNYDTPVGLIGLGAIGAGVARRLVQDYRLTVYAYDPFCTQERAAELGVRLADPEEIFSTCLTVSNHTANIPATRGMLNYALFSRMLPNATFINTGRGAQVVEEDLVRALREEPGRTAVLDVTDPEPSPEGHPFYGMDNVILTPHIAGSVGAECFRMGAWMLDEARRWLSGEPLRYEVTEKMLATMA